MAREIATLQTKAALPSETAQPEEREHTALPAPTKMRETTQPTPPLAKVATPTLSGPGICSRTPEIQNEILVALDVQLCQVVNAHELFRITKLPTIKASSIKEGDFHGLVNVERLALRIGSVEANGLTGLERVKDIHVYIENKNGLQRESFSGLENLEELEIVIKGTPFPELPRMQNLKHLSVYGMRPHSSEGEPYTPFKNLPNLETLKLRILLGEEAEETRTEPHHILPALLEGAGNLKEVTIKTRVKPSGHEIQLPEDMFRENPLLERVDIEYPRTFIEKHTFSHLHNLKELLVLNSTSWDPVNEPALVISKASPLYQSIRAGETKPSRYRIVDPTED